MRKAPDAVADQELPAASRVLASASVTARRKGAANTRGLLLAGAKIRAVPPDVLTPTSSLSTVSAITPAAGRPLTAVNVRMESGPTDAPVLRRATPLLVPAQR